MSLTIDFVLVRATGVALSCLILAPLFIPLIFLAIPSKASSILYMLAALATVIGSMLLIVAFDYCNSTTNESGTLFAPLCQYTDLSLVRSLSILNCLYWLTLGTFLIIRYRKAPQIRATLILSAGTFGSTMVGLAYLS